MFLGGILLGRNISNEEPPRQEFKVFKTVRWMTDSFDLELPIAAYSEHYLRQYPHEHYPEDANPHAGAMQACFCLRLAALQLPAVRLPLPLLLPLLHLLLFRAVPPPATSCNPRQTLRDLRSAQSLPHTLGVQSQISVKSTPSPDRGPPFAGVYTSDFGPLA
jgi:hypothetical protein